VTVGRLPANGGKDSVDFANQRHRRRTRQRIAKKLRGVSSPAAHARLDGGCAAVLARNARPFRRPLALEVAMSDATTTQWLTLREAAKHERCSGTTISRAARSGELRGWKLRSRGSWRFDAADVDRWLKHEQRRFADHSVG